ncbi:cytochrome c oxidase assembly protein COX18, mitochondrial-like [Lytechinus variegatus]|uniref:cytochrome c oxidase assembly protein COX18, mitochondrial-like n=1 Tax=Lytechinus variegatus TaxID=7654 RepID=UPI001BB2C8F4|nr:cytochrome c oxidase assembly protein COX18, mitochondrial-like [Lytechinus variegatus]XP_041485828.1 cytochrome c oxidase assembly protein COX18, mitochondrial-like [Lytechinus variegatus]
MYHPVFRPSSLTCFQRGFHRVVFKPRTSCSHHLHVSLPYCNPRGQSLHIHVHSSSSSLNSQRNVSRNNELATGIKTNQPFNQHLNHLQAVQFSSYSSSPGSSATFLQPSGVASTRQQVRHSSTEPTTAYEALLNSQPVHFAEGVFQYVHSLTGLSWWATIVVTTFALRFSLTLPLAIYSQNIRVRVENLQPEVIALAKRAFVDRLSARAKNEKWSEKRAQRAFVGLVRRYSKELYVRDNCHPAKGSILFLVQLPMWIFLSLALRNMTGALSERMYVDPTSIVPDLATGGVLWFPSLVAPDPTFILPVLVGLLNLSNIEMHALHRGRVTRVQRYVNNTLRTVSVAMIPIAAYMPSAMALYWSVSAFYGLGQNILLKIPSARRALGMRSSQSDTDTPFKDMRDEFLVRYLSKERGKGKKDELLEEIQDGEKVQSKKTKL